MSSSNNYYLYDSRYQQKALQERSSNLQQQHQSIYLADDGDFSKMSIFPGVALPPQAPVQPQEHYPTTDLSGWDPDSRKFWHDIYNEASYVKELALQCQPYKAYRDKNKDAIARDTSSLGKNEGLKWPDILEDAFWRACVRFPPRYRVKGSWQGSQAKYGRNQLISKSIEQETGFIIDEAGDEKEPGDDGQCPTKEKPRKFISSHIQVITGHMNKADPSFKYKAQVLKHLISDKPKKQLQGSRMSRAKTAQRMGRELMVQAAGRDSRRMAPYRLPTSQTSTPSIDYQFRMFVHASNDPSQRVLHVYTESFANARRQDVRLDNHPELYDRIPPLKAYLPTSGESCDLFVAEGLISLPSRAFPNESSLTIENVLRLEGRLNPALNWHTRTLVFTEKNTEPSFSQINPVDIRQEHGKWTNTMFFCSSWWRDQLHRWAHSLRVANQNAREDDPESMLAHDKLHSRVRRQLESTTVVQELIGYPRSQSDDQSKTERRLAFFWTFRLAEKLEKPRVKYHQLQMPFQGVSIPEVARSSAAPYMQLPSTEPTMSHRHPGLDTQAFDLSFSGYDANAAAALSFDQYFDTLSDIPEITVPTIITTESPSEPHTAQISPTHSNFGLHPSRRGSYHEDTLPIDSTVSLGAASQADPYSGLSILAGAAVQPESQVEQKIVRSQPEAVLSPAPTLPSQPLPSSSWPNSQRLQRASVESSVRTTQSPQQPSYIYTMPNYWSQPVQHVNQHLQLPSQYPHQAHPQPTHARHSYSILSASDDEIASGHIAHDSRRHSDSHGRMNYILEHSYEPGDMRPRIVNVTTPPVDAISLVGAEAKSKLDASQARISNDDENSHIYNNSYFMTLSGEDSENHERSHSRVISSGQIPSMPID